MKYSEEAPFASVTRQSELPLILKNSFPGNSTDGDDDARQGLRRHISKTNQCCFEGPCLRLLTLKPGCYSKKRRLVKHIGGGGLRVRESLMQANALQARRQFDGDI